MGKSKYRKARLGFDMSLLSSYGNTYYIIPLWGVRNPTLYNRCGLCSCMGSLDSEDRDRDRDREITDRVAADQGGADRIAELEARIDELEERLTRSAWSRRGILGLLGIGGVASLSGNAAAGSAQVGTIGTQNKPVDIEGEDISADSITELGNNIVTSPNADRDIYVIASGASNPAAADSDDIILEKS